MKKLSQTLFFGAIAAGTVYEIFEHAVPARNSVTVSVPEPLAGLKLLLLSDLHCNPFICRNKAFVDRLAMEKPDAILLAGDMINKYGRAENGRVPFFLIQLAKIAPVAACLGNHEEMLRQQFPEQYELYHMMLTHAGIYLLDNEAITLKIKGRNVSFCGFSVNPSYYFVKGKRSFLNNYEINKLPDIPYDSTILLAHQPDFFETYCQLSPLVVSGHVHGGIVRLPKIGGLVSPQGYFPPYSHGCYKMKDSTLVVTSGIGSHSLPARLFNRIEYCVIHTKSEDLQ